MTTAMFLVLSALAVRSRQPAVLLAVLVLWIEGMIVPVRGLDVIVLPAAAVSVVLPMVFRGATMTAEVIRRPELGHLSVGAEADVAVLELQQGSFGFTAGLIVCVPVVPMKSV